MDNARTALHISPLSAANSNVKEDNAYREKFLLNKDFAGPAQIIPFLIGPRELALR